jgi:hypothetical protein
MIGTQQVWEINDMQVIIIRISCSKVKCRKTHILGSIIISIYLLSEKLNYQYPY